MEPISIIIGASVGLLAGALIVFIMQKSVLKSKAQAIVKEAEAEGETIKKDKFTNNVFTSEQNQEFSNDNIRKNILGFTGGVDINIKNAVLGLRAGRDFQNNNGDGTSSTPRYKNAWIQATLGVRVF